MKPLLLAILQFFFWATSLNAQLKEFEINEMPRPDVSIVQANAAFPDDALIIVYSSLDNLSFRSSMGMIDKQSYNSQSNRYEVLIRPIKQILLVYTDDYMEGTIAKLNPNSKEVFYYKVEEKKGEIPEAGTGKFNIKSEPLGADIYLNGYKVADKTPFTFDLNSGATRIKLKKKKFDDFDTTVVIQATKINVLSAKLKPSFLFLNVISDPVGAAVRLDEVELGKTPLSKEIDLSDKQQRGLKMLRIEAEGYEVITEQLSIVPSSAALERSFELKRLKASFAINSSPSGASVYIDGTYKGITPYNGSKEYGTHEIYLQMDEYRTSEKKQLILSKSGNQTVEFTLRPLPKIREGIEIGEGSVQEIEIGKQVWMIVNLNTDSFQNGNTIPEVKNGLEWVKAGENRQPAWCYYDNNPINGEKYGKLYNWYAVADSRGLCPAGFHVPNDNEWNQLIEFLGGAKVAGKKMKTKTGRGFHWKGNNISGFSGLPGGFRSHLVGYFYNIGNNGYWWSLTDYSTISDWNRNLHYSNGYAGRGYGNKQIGFSVRCIKD
jgi:uncharacterized protein (TIGR02145 family)